MADLTDAYIRRLKPPDKGNKVHYDDEVAGFGVRITMAGARAFVLNYRTKSGRERRYTIGACADWTTTDARKEAKRLRHLVDQGGDPLADLEAEREAPTVHELCDRFEREHLPRLRPSSQKEYRGMLAKHIRPHFTSAAKVADVSSDDIDRLHRRITTAGHLTRANRVIAVTSKMFSLAIRWNIRTDNPCKGVEHNPETMRRRYVKSDGPDSELVRLTAALAQHPDQKVADIVRLLLLTGARSGEVLAMRWADIDLGVGKWSKPAASTKQGQDHEVPLSAPARQLLSALREQQTSGHRVLGEYVFPGPGDSRHRVELRRGWRRICTAAGISGLRIHDLRHSFASQLVSGGHSLPLIGALLGHSNPSTTQRYAHLFDDPQRAAVETIGALIGAAGQPAVEPTPLRRRP